MASNKPSKKKRQRVEKRYEFEYKEESIYDVPMAVTHLRFHPSVIRVKFNACHNHKQLREVELNEGLQCIMTCAFLGCENLQSITLPSTVIYIGMNAFNGCSSLREVIFNEGLTQIGEETFNACSSLQSINLPSTLTGIGRCSFMDCSSLTELVLNEGLTRIGEQAFQNCSSVNILKLPSTVTEVGQYAFNDMNLEMVEFDENIPETIQRYALSLVERFKYPDLSSRLKTVIEAGQVIIEEKIREIPEVEWRDNELVVPASVGRMRNSWPLMGRKYVAGVDREKLEEIKRLIRYYEMKEATTLFELALWKTMVDQKEADINREAYRTEVPGPVKDTILHYLYCETDFNWAGWIDDDEDEYDRISWTDG